MKFHLLYASSVTACFDLENTSPYYAHCAYDVAVNGAPALLGVRTNVFSLFDLEPEKEYSVVVGEESITFTTSGETGCISVKDFGAIGDGAADDTDAIQNAIHCCPVGGRVTVPAGTYYVRPLVLKSHITLELKEGALLLADTCEEHYPILPGSVSDARTGEEPVLREAMWRSDGTVDQLYLALRLAVAEELTPHAPLVLDDALVRFDDQRLAAALEVLGEISQTRQILLFTCQSREKNTQSL